MLNAAIITAITVGLLPVWLVMSWHQANRPRTPRRTLVIQRAKLGDLVCTTPLLRALAQRGDHVTLLCLQSSAGVVEHNPHVKEVLVGDGAAYQGLTGRLRLLWTMFRGRFDVAIAVMPNGTSALLTLWSAAGQRIYARGEHLGAIERLCLPFCTVRQYRQGTRTFDHFMQLAEAAGAQTVPYAHDVFLSEDEQQAADHWLTEHGLHGGQPFAILSVSAGNVIKSWPLERFAQVAEHLAQRWQLPVLVSTLNTDLTKQTVSLIQTEGTFIDAGGLPLRLLMGVIARASLFVSVDTGPLYIAHACQVPLVDIIGPVHPNEQPPIPGDSVEIVRPPDDIAPSSFVLQTLRMETANQRRALDETTVPMVTEAIDRLLAKHLSA